MDQLGLRTLLDQLGLGASIRAVAIGTIIARMAQSAPPGAGLANASPWANCSGWEFATMGPMRLYRASDALMAHRDVIKPHLFDRAMDLFEIEPTVMLHVRKATRAGPTQQAIYKARGIDPAPGRTRKNLVSQTFKHPLAVPLAASAYRNRLIYNKIL